MAKTAFLLDCDGVLLDSIGAWHGLDAQLAAEAGITLNDEDRAALNASTLGEAAAYFHNHYGVGRDTAEVEERFTSILMEYYRNEAAEVPGALAFVQAARDAGVELCVLSSSPQAFLQAGLTRAGFLNVIGRVLSAEDLPYKKRDPQMYPYVCDVLGVALEDTWLFDDSWYALETAHNAGIHTVGVFSANECGTHEQLALFGERVVDDFIGLDINEFLKPTI